MNEFLKRYMGMQVWSAGHKQHEWTSWAAIDGVFPFLEENHQLSFKPEWQAEVHLPDYDVLVRTYPDPPREIDEADDTRRPVGSSDAKPGPSGSCAGKKSKPNESDRKTANGDEASCAIASDTTQASYVSQTKCTGSGGKSNGDAVEKMEEGSDGSIHSSDTLMPAAAAKQPANEPNKDEKKLDARNGNDL